MGSSERDLGAAPGAEEPSTLFGEFEPLPPRSEGRGAMRKALWLVGCVYLLLFATTGLVILRTYQDRVAEAHLANSNLARAVAERLEGTITEADLVIRTVAHELERGDPTPAAAERLQPALVHHVAASDRLKNLFVIGADGQWLASSVPYGPSASSSEDDYFVHHRDSLSASTRVGPPVISRTADAWVVPVSRRITDADGRFAGVVLATISVERLRAMLVPYDIGNGAITLTVAGRYIVRRPYVTAEIGQPVHPQLLDTMSGDGQGIGDSRSPIDGVWRLYSYEYARNYPLGVLVAASKHEVLRGWALGSALQLLWTLCLCLLLHLASRYVRGSLQSRLRAEAGLRRASAQLAEANERLAQLARYDELTGLPNRRYFDRQFVRALRQAQRDQRPLAVVMVDVDEFKKYNDSQGHVAGDDCLRQIAAALRASIKRPSDFVARYGGEEMVMLLPHTDAAGATRIADGARAAVAALALPHPASRLGHVTLSMGVASWVPAPDEDGQALLQAADAALYAAKHGGRNAVHTHGLAPA